MGQADSRFYAFAVFAARFAAQYFFIRSDTAFLAAADHLGRFWTDVASAASSLPGLTPALFRMLALPSRRWGKVLMSAAISAFSSSSLCSAPLRAISRMCDVCLAIGQT
jgi:hypothetical protein